MYTIRWGRLTGQEDDQADVEDASGGNPWEKLFSGTSDMKVKIIKKKRRSKSVDISTPERKPLAQRIPL